jgi:hypothetical protein
VIVAALLAAAGILVAIQAVSAALGHPLWNVPHGDFAGPAQTRRWADSGTLAVAGAIAFVGLVLILIGLVPGRPRAVPLASGDDSVVIGVPVRSLRHSLAWLAQDVEGIDSAKVRGGRRTVRVRVTTRLRDTAGLRESVHAAVQARLDALEPLWPPRVKVRLRRKEG